MRFSCFLIFSVLSLTPSTSLPVVTAPKISKTSIQLLTDVANVWENFNKYHTQPVRTFKDRRVTLFTEKIDTAVTGLDQMNQDLKSFINDVNIMVRLSKRFPETFQNETEWNKIQIIQIHIEYLFSEMSRYVRDIEKYEKNTLNNFSNRILNSMFNSVPIMMQEILGYVKTTNFLRPITQQLKTVQGTLFCNLQQSHQEIYHTILKELLMTNAKAYMTIQVAYIFKKISTEGTANYNKEIKDALNDFKNKTNDLINDFTPFLNTASRELWRCDPKQHTQGETYVAFMGLLQGIILNEQNLNKKHSCGDSCEDYTYTKRYKTDDKLEWSNIQPKPQCTKVLGCRFIANEMTVCKSKNSTEGRRYDYIQFENGRTFGRKKYCPRHYISHLSTYKQKYFWSCPFCVCLCDEPQHSHRYINLRASLANLANNRVVTGIRFIKHNNITHLQIQEGELLPDGQINMETVRWVPPEDYKITDRNYYEEQDYHILNFEQRGIDLIDVMAGKKSAVTGVRIRKIGTRLELEVLSTPFNFTTGKLITGRSLYKHNPNVHIRHKFGKELRLLQPDIPTKRGHMHTPDRTGAVYVKFTNTDFDKDAAQTTVPFFDAQPVVSSPPTPLSGIGFFHKGRTGSGGFIAPKIYTYDFTQHLSQ